MLKDKYRSIISESLFDLLTSVYPLAKRSLIEVETRERIKALGAFTDLRDIFDHFYLALKYASDGSSDEDEMDKLIRDNISSAYEHLRRAAIEPLETLLEDLLSKIIERARYNCLLYPIKLSSISNKEVMSALSKAQTELASIRKAKGQINQLSPTLEKLEEQYTILTEIERKLPTKIAVKIVAVSMAMLLLGFILGILIRSVVW